MRLPAPPPKRKETKTTKKKGLAGFRESKINEWKNKIDGILFNLYLDYRNSKLLAEVENESN